MPEKIKTDFPGVRYREHKTRKYGLMKDRCFFIRHCASGKWIEESVGWGSKDMTAKKAKLEDLKKRFIRIYNITLLALRTGMRANEDCSNRWQSLCFYSCRHTFASRLAESGIDLYIIKQLMGIPLYYSLKDTAI